MAAAGGNGRFVNEDWKRDVDAVVLNRRLGRPGCFPRKPARHKLFHVGVCEIRFFRHRVHGNRDAQPRRTDLVEPYFLERQSAGPRNRRNAPLVGAHDDDRLVQVEVGSALTQRRLSQDLLHLTGGSPFLSALTSTNQITIDFSGAALAAGQLYRGGFFTDIPTDTSLVSNAAFVYLGLNGFDVHFYGFVTENSANFESGVVLNGGVLQCDIEGTGSTVPDTASSLLLLSLALVPLLGLQRRRLS